MPLNTCTSAEAGGFPWVWSQPGEKEGSAEVQPWGNSRILLRVTGLKWAFVLRAWWAMTWASAGPASLWFRPEVCGLGCQSDSLRVPPVLFGVALSEVTLCTDSSVIFPNLNWFSVYRNINILTQQWGSEFKGRPVTQSLLSSMEKLKCRKIKEPPRAHTARHLRTWELDLVESAAVREDDPEGLPFSLGCHLGVKIQGRVHCLQWPRDLKAVAERVHCLLENGDRQVYAQRR